MEIPCQYVILSIAKDLIPSTLCKQIFRTESSTTRLRFVQNDTTK